MPDRCVYITTLSGIQSRRGWFRVARDYSSISSNVVANHCLIGLCLIPIRRIIDFERDVESNSRRWMKVRPQNLAQFQICSLPPNHKKSIFKTESYDQKKRKVSPNIVVLGESPIGQHGH